MVDSFRKIDTTAVEGLSPGQEQVVNFLLALSIRPRLLFLDDATSSLSEQVVGQLYDESARLGITVVTLSSSEHLSKHHTTLVRLESLT